MSKLHLSLLCLATAGLMLAGCGDSEKKVTGPETEVGTEQSYNEVSSPVRSAKPAGSQDVTVVTAAIGNFYGVSSAVTFVDPLPADAVIAEIHASFQASNSYSPGYYSQNIFFLNGTPIGEVHTEGNYGGWTPREFTYVGHPAGYVSGGTNSLQVHAWWNSVNLSAVTLTITYTLPAAQVWTASGPGVVTLVSDGSSADPEMSYNLSEYGTVFNTQTWDFTTTATQTGQVTLPYQYSGYHAYFQVRVFVQAIVDGAPVATLVNDGPVNCCSSPSGGFNYTGNYTYNVTAGQTYGFRFGGSNYDSDARLLGTFKVAEFAPPPPADTTPPVIVLNGPADLSLECHLDSYTELGATATDDVSGAVAVTITGSVDTNVEGDYTITYTATDAAGNTSTATRTVHVVDAAPPAITLNGAAALTLECHVDSYTELGATANDLCDGAVAVTTTGSVNTNAEGTYTITYTAVDGNGHVATATRTVHVVDTTAPAITLNGAATQTIECHVGTYTELGATANDLCDGAVAVTTSGSVNTNAEGTYTITYTAADAAGHTTTATRTVQVVDTLAPAVTLTGAATQTIECHVGTYTELGATASDLCDGAVAVVISGSVNTNAEGTYTVTYTATDAAGNTSTATRTVQLVDTTKPNLTLTLSSTSLWPPNHNMVQVATVSAVDACDPNVALSIGVTSNEPENGTGDGDTGPDWQITDNGDGTATVSVRAERKGNGTGRIYKITVTATDDAGNVTAAKTGTVTVAVSQGKKK